MAHVYALIEREAAESVDPYEAFYRGAIPGMLRQLDPHSVFFDPAQFEQLKELERSTRKGFGSVVSLLPGRVIVLQTLSGTPSARAGIEPGDEILAINGIRLDWLDVDQLVGLLTEFRQREVRLDVRRPGSARLLEFVLTPEEMQSPSVERTFFVGAGVGYIRVASFESETGKQLKEAIEKLGGRRLRALVLDLRDNAGGLLPAALETASLFLPPKSRILTIRGRATQADEVTVPETASPYAFPVAILVNGKTASAAEIVAGALQDHDRATLVGEPSFGKGLVQSVFPLSEGTGLALTTAFYYTPSGRSIQKPLREGRLGNATTLPAGPEEAAHRTDSGRPLKGGGGLHPDHLVHPPASTRLRLVLEATASFTNFATEYLRKTPSLPEDFEVTPALLDDFQAFLSQRNIRPGVSEWSADRDWIRSRLEQEILNQALGVEKGDEVEARRDPQVLKALEVLGAG